MIFGFKQDKSKAEVLSKDEVYSKDELYNKIELNNLLHVEKLSDSNIKVAANAGASILCNTPVISGYSFVGVVGCDVAPTNPPNFNVTIQSCGYHEDYSDVLLVLSNRSNADVYVNFTLYLLYAKDNFI